jgi:hypothetical protein
MPLLSGPRQPRNVHSLRPRRHAVFHRWGARPRGAAIQNQGEAVQVETS